MKESAKILTVIMVIVFGFASIANTSRKERNERVQLVPCENGKVKLVYLKKCKEDVNVSILNKKGESVLNEEVNAEGGFLNEYDLKEYGTGDYTFRITDINGVHENEVFFEGNKNLVFCEIGNTGKFRLVMESVDDLNIEVFNDEDRLLFSDNIRSRKAVNKLFDLSRILDTDDQEISFVIKYDNELLKIATF